MSSKRQKVLLDDERKETDRHCCPRHAYRRGVACMLHGRAFSKCKTGQLASFNLRIEHCKSRAMEGLGKTCVSGQMSI